MIHDARAERHARLDRLATVRDATGHGPAAELADIVGCHAEQRRDLWIFRNDAFLAHVPHQSIDAEGGFLILGDLRLPHDGSITSGTDEFDFLLYGVPHSLNAADEHGAGYEALDEIDRLLDGASSILVSVDGRPPVLLPRAEVSTSGRDIPSLDVVALGVSIPFHAIGHRGLVRRDDDVIVLGLGGSTVSLRIQASPA